METKTRSKRPYLSRDKRRETLLDAAAAIVDEQGWPALTMMAVADRAEVSRQLVYQHFSSVEELILATMRAIFREPLAMMQQTLSEDGNLTEASMLAPRSVAALPRGRRMALWQVISTPYSEDSEIGKASRRIRHLVVKLTAPAVARGLNVSQRTAEELSWMLNIAFWGGMHGVDDGDMDVETALERYAWLIRRTILGSAAGSPESPDADTTVSASRRARAAND